VIVNDAPVKALTVEDVRAAIDRVRRSAPPIRASRLPRRGTVSAGSIAHVAFETTAALSRMPEGQRLAPAVVMEWLEIRFMSRWIALPAVATRRAVRAAIEHASAAALSTTRWSPPRHATTTTPCSPRIAEPPPPTPRSEFRPST
jgi:hypothetical protein